MEDATKYGRVAVKLYLAAPWDDRKNVNALAVELERTPGVNVVSTWHLPQDVDGSECLAAEIDLEEVVEADALVLLSTALNGGACSERLISGGRHVETGYALALGKQVIVVGERENIFHHLSRVLVVPDVHGLKTLLAFRCAAMEVEA